MKPIEERRALLAHRTSQRSRQGLGSNGTLPAGGVEAQPSPSALQRRPDGHDTLVVDHQANQQVVGPALATPNAGPGWRYASASSDESVLTASSAPEAAWASAAIS